MYATNRKKTLMKIVVGVSLFVTIVPYITMLLWNALMPVIFGITTITYIQALGLLLLSKILFSGFSHIGGRSGCNSKPEHIRKFQDRMQDLCDESKAKKQQKASSDINDKKPQE